VKDDYDEVFREKVRGCEMKRCGVEEVRRGETRV
jgi:hypothetical protein